MQRILQIVTFIFLSYSVAAQTGGMEYLLDGNIRVSAFGGPIVEFSSFSDDMVVSSGGGGALLLNRKLFIGGYGLSSGDKASSNQDRLDLGHGGFWVGYLNDPDRLIHWGITSKLGWGEAVAHIGGARTTDNVFVISPEAIVEFNIARWFKINLGGGYRVVTGLREGGALASDEFNTPTFTINFAFGWFGQ